MREVVWELADRVVAGEELNPEQKKMLFTIPDEYILDLLSAAYRIKLRFKGKKISRCSIVSAKTGYCSEDCAFCAQSARSRAKIEKHHMIPPEKMLEAALKAEEAGAERFSIVTSGKGYMKPGRSLEKILEGVTLIRENTELIVDVSLGILSREVMERLAKAGVARIHHNIETSPSYFNKIVSTHSFRERFETVKTIKDTGLEACSGFIIGMGEGVEDRIEMVEALNSLRVDSVPINILVPIQGTPLENLKPIKPLEAVKSIAAFRFLMPEKELRLCGGRTQNLRDLQVLSLFAVDGIMVGHKALTTSIRHPELDRKMLEDVNAL